MRQNESPHEEQLILHYYGEEGDGLAAEQHLDGCGECRGVLRLAAAGLNVVDSLPVPDARPITNAGLETGGMPDPGEAPFMKFAGAVAMGSR